MSGSLVLGSRGSDLALWQARRVAALIGERLGLECRIEIVKTRGDRIQDVAFAKMEGKGFFTKELQDALLEGRVDLVVHSLKDLPTEEPDGLEVVAVPERANPADLLLARTGALRQPPDGSAGLEPGAVLGTSSLRRAAQALDAWPGISVKALRGNVPTRVDKLRRGGYDAILLAAAGLRRLALDLDGLDVVELTPEVMLPAPGQGALAVEARRDDPSTRLLAALHDPEAARLVAVERRLLQLLGGGCHLPLGCLAVPEDGGIRLTAALGAVDDAVTRVSMSRVSAIAADPEAAAHACFEALQAAPPELGAP
ncbi:MAG TPA: hydroxymethylbilane synthase [Methylomirabilota bacterium]|nr:hydroxymethylbilane synthase [Methylomirabilota bacterium]